MSDEMMLILEKLDTMNHSLAGIEGKVDNTHEHLLRLEESTNERFMKMEDRFAGLEERFAGLEDRFTQSEAATDLRFNRVEQKLESMGLMLENEISKKIDAIGEGHDYLKRNLDDALRVEKDKEWMELNILNLRMDVRKIKDKLAMA
ncbi:MAG: hypothetical protein LUH21_01770 [Clostridiales bacterium]|nr:hypothetical protein [Clostridiales bacterium]